MSQSSTVNISSMVTPNTFAIFHGDVVEMGAEEHEGNQGNHFRHKGKGSGLLDILLEEFVRHDPKAAEVIGKAEKPIEPGIFCSLP